MSETPSVEFIVSDGIAEIAINRPQRRNALDLVARELLASHIAQAVGDDSVRAIVLTGRGGHFCAGGDITTMATNDGGISAEQGRQRMRSALRMVELLYTSDKPVVAAVEGCAFGGGFGLALACDIVVASRTARFGMSFPRVGLVPDSAAMYTLPRIVGLQRAKEIMLSGRELSAEEAYGYGMLSELVDEGATIARARAMAQALTNASPVAMALTKTGLNNSLSSDLRSMVEFEATAQGVAFSSDYHREAVKAFLSKQPARFFWPKA